MKNLELNQMESLRGGYSWASCLARQMNVVVFGLVIHEPEFATWEECRMA